MRNVFRIAGIFILLYVLEEYAGVDGTLIAALYLLTFVYAGYLIFKAISGRSNRPVQTFVSPTTPPAAATPLPAPKRRFRGLIFVILLVVALVSIKYLGIISINFILFMNRLLEVSASASPVVLWAVMGLFVGMIYGSLVAWRKYRLPLGFAIFPFAALAIFVAIMFALNDPLKPQTRRVAASEDAFRFVSLRSSGHLPGYRSNNYEDSNLVDGDERTTWIENAKNAGIGEWIAFRFNTTHDIERYRKFMCTGFRILNGYAKSEKLYSSHNRVREFRVEHNGNTIGNFTASDAFNRRELIAIKPFPVKYDDVVTVHINSVYYGTQNNKLTAISELVPIVEIIE